MSLLDGIMAHQFMVVIPGTETQDEYGEVVSTPASESGPYSGLFFSPDGSIIDLTSGQHLKKNVRLMYEPSVSLKKGSQVRGLTAGYRETYTVQNVMPAHHLDILDHYESDLEIVS